MKNKLTDLSNHLYAQLERLNDESLKGQDLELECQRADAMAKIASNIIGASNTTLSALRLIQNGAINQSQLHFLKEINQ